MEFVFLGGMRIMDDFLSLTQLTDDEREKACEKYRIIESYINNETTLTNLAKTKSIPVRTLRSWVKKYQAAGLTGLARQQRSDKGTPRQFDQALQKTIEGIYLKKPMLTISNIHGLIKEYCHKHNIKPPGYRSICRVISKIPDDLVLLAREGSKVYKQKYDLLHIRSAENPNELWQADHVLLDFDILNSRNKLQKPWLTVVMDDCSRAICGYELSFISPSAKKTSLCFRHAMWRKSDPRWEILGVPDTLYTDHGSDFTSRHIDQVCIDLKIKLIFSQVGQPRGRGKIERFFRTLDQMMLNMLRGLQKGPQNTMDLKTFDKIIYDFIIKYNHTCHPEIKNTPADRWKQNGFLPRILDSIENLDLLLLTEARPRKILRDGIRFQGLRYMDTILAEYVGEDVVIRFTPSNISSVRVFYKGQYLCQALCPELASLKIDIKEIERARNKKRADLRKKISERKSLVEAVIDASSLAFDSSTESATALITIDRQPNPIKLYKDE